MSTWTFSSCLASQIETFINLRRLSNGTDYRSQTESLKHFDRFLVAHGIQQARIGMVKMLMPGFRHWPLTWAT